MKDRRRVIEETAHAFGSDRERDAWQLDPVAVEDGSYAAVRVALEDRAAAGESWSVLRSKRRIVACARPTGAVIVAVVHSTVPLEYSVVVVKGERTWFGAQAMDDWGEVCRSVGAHSVSDHVRLWYLLSGSPAVIEKHSAPRPIGGVSALLDLGVTMEALGEHRDRATWPLWWQCWGGTLDQFVMRGAEAPVCTTLAQGIGPCRPVPISWIR